MPNLDHETMTIGCRAHAAALDNGGRNPFPLPGDTPHYGRDRAADIRHIRVEIGFGLDDRRIFGAASHTLAAIHDGLTALDFDAVELDVSSVTMDGVARRPQAWRSCTSSPAARFTSSSAGRCGQARP